MYENKYRTKICDFTVCDAKWTKLARGARVTDKNEDEVATLLTVIGKDVRTVYQTFPYVKGRRREENSACSE